jgi:hypothetical protein
MRCVAVAVALALLVPAGARATIILDTYPANGVLWKPIGIAVPFGPLGPDTVVTGVTAAIRGSTAPVTLGVMGDAAGVPSGHFLVSETVTPALDTDLTLSGLDWHVPGLAPLWLAVLESPAFAFGLGFWQANAGLDRPWAFEADLGGPWFGHSDQSPAVLIEAENVPAPVPEPPFAWLPLTLLALGAGAARALGIGARSRREAR